MRNHEKKRVLMLFILHCAIIIFCIAFFVLEKKGRFYGEYTDSDSRYFSVYGVRDEERQGYFVDELIGGVDYLPAVLTWS